MARRDPDELAAELDAATGAADPWPPLDTGPATAELHPAPALDLAGLLPAGWPEWVEAAAEGHGAPPDAVACALVAAASAAIGNARWAQPRPGWKEPPVLNLALVGRPGSGKSRALDAVRGELYALHADEDADWQERRREHETAKANAAAVKERWQGEVKEAAKHGLAPPLIPADALDADPPQRRRLLSTQPSPEKAARLSHANPRGLLLDRDESGGWIAGMDRYGSGGGNGEREFWLETYGGRVWMPDRVKDGDAELGVPHLTWGIIGGIQPDRLASLVLAKDDDGLAARFLYCWPEPRRPGDHATGAIPDTWRTGLARLRRDLPWEPPHPILVPFAPGARAVVAAWEQQTYDMGSEASGLFLGWLGRLNGVAIRLALVLQHLEWAARPAGVAPPAEVGEVATLRAVAFLEGYALPMARRVFGDAALPQAERDSRTLARWMLRRRPLPAVLNVRGLRRVAGGPGIPDAPRLSAAMEELAALGWVRPAPGREGGIPGRPRNDWAVHPELTGGDGLG